MAGQHGGHRTPAHPAPQGSSGPGALSKRTDGAPGQPVRLQTDQPYGDREESLQQQKQAPLAQTPTTAAMPVPSGGAAAPPGSSLPFGAASQRPGEPITHGVDIGPGGGPAVLGMGGPGQMPTGYLTNLLQGLSATDMTGTLGQLYLMAKQRGV